MNKTVFAKCPDHGDAPALTRTVFKTRHISASMVAQGFRATSYTVEEPCTDGKLAGCATCRKFVPARIINALSADEAARYGNPCNGRCTSGKRDCECKCAGVCHGRGECVCGKVA